MSNRPSSFDYNQLLACGRGEMFAEGPQLPLPPMLMFDRISEISERGGEHGKDGARRARRQASRGLRCHQREPIMRLSLDACHSSFFVDWPDSTSPRRAHGMRGESEPVSTKEGRVRHRPISASIARSGASRGWLRASSARAIPLPARRPARKSRRSGRTSASAAAEARSSANISPRPQASS